MINLKLTPRVHPLQVDKAPKYFPAVVSKGDIDFKSLSTKIAQRSCLSRTDCETMICALEEIIPEELLQGYIVRLGSLGSLRLTVKGEGVDSPQQFRSSLINKVQLRYNPSLDIKEELKRAQFKVLE